MTYERNHPRCFACALSAAVCIGLGGVASPAAVADGDSIVTITETFDEHMGPWTARGYLTCMTTCPRFFWDLTRSQEEAHTGDTSLRMEVNGYWDDGTIWIERPLELSPSVWDISVSFQALHDPTVFNGLIPVAYIGTERPESTADFVTLGGVIEEGWTEWSHSELVHTLHSTQAWVAIGFHVTWETCETNFLDTVTVSGIEKQPEHRPGDLNHDGVVDVQDVVKLIENWGPCPQKEYVCPCSDGVHDCTASSPETDCIGDITGSAGVGLDDLLLLIENWG